MGFSDRARAFSYLLLCSDVEYDVKLLSQLPRPVLQGSAGRSWWMESTIWVESKECGLSLIHI